MEGIERCKKCHNWVGHESRCHMNLKPEDSVQCTPEGGGNAFVEGKMPRVGDHVVWTNPVFVDFNAIVTCVFGPTCLNLVMIEEDNKREDSYGRQIKRETSVVYSSQQPAYGCYWRWPGEKKNPIIQPVEK